MNEKSSLTFAVIILTIGIVGSVLIGVYGLGPLQLGPADFRG